ncbi:glutaredoxin domain-containing protein [Isoptericola haloaureus]|uniref:Glutaredoxin domain-containing protein n=1 Tax=Isoptericola haloaureus TaxID=1542902 RepID=A0ABU7Z8Q0_9MICO
MSAPTVHVFTKPDCVYCRSAKHALDRAGIAYDQHDVTADERTADTAAYYSGRHTVPQVFAGDTWIEAPEDVRALADDGRLAHLVDAAAGPAPWDAAGSAVDGVLARGAEDVPLHRYLSTSDGTHDDDPESWPILRFYHDFFGFWPNTFAYLHHWPTAYKLFVYCQNLASVRGAVDVVGHGGMAAIGYATSAAQGCSYCMTHAVAYGGQDLDVPAALSDARRGGSDDGPLGPFEAALADLAARATRHAVTAKSLDAVRRTAPDARVGAVDPDAAIQAATQVAASFGFLNVFNDLGGLEIEGDWAATAAARGVDAGRHGVADTNPDNLSHALPQGGPTLQEMLADYARRVGDPEDYAAEHLGLVPSWVRAWPEASRRHHVYLYTELMGDGEGSRVPAELKHLMARVSAVARDHASLAAVEGYLATRAPGAGDRSVERVRRAYDAALGRDDGGAFDDAERAALRLAWLSAQAPLTTPRRFVEAVTEHFDTQQVVELMVACAVASMVQRFVAVSSPETEPEVGRFLARHDLAADPLDVRYPAAQRA